MATKQVNKRSIQRVMTLMNDFRDRTESKKLIKTAKEIIKEHNLSSSYSTLMRISNYIEHQPEGWVWIYPHTINEALAESLIRVNMLFDRYKFTDRKNAERVAALESDIDDENDKSTQSIKNVLDKSKIDTKQLKLKYDIVESDKINQPMDDTDTIIDLLDKAQRYQIPVGLRKQFVKELKPKV